MVKITRTRKLKAAARSRKKATPTQKAKSAKAKSETKCDQVLALLRRPGGASIAVMAKATGWQNHSVRGFLAGTVRKKLGLNLESKKQDGERLYRVTGAKPPAAQAKAA
jgi:Protein of unknown function (DUF3489)